MCSQFGTRPPLPGSLDYLHSNGHDCDGYVQDGDGNGHDGNGHDGDGNGHDGDGNGHGGDSNGHDGDEKGQVTIMVISDCQDQGDGNGW